MYVHVQAAIVGGIVIMAAGLYSMNFLREWRREMTELIKGPEPAAAAAPERKGP